MITKEIPRQEWQEFFDSFSRQHDRWLVTLEVFGPDIGAQVQAQETPLHGIVADLKESGQDKISIIVGKEVEGGLTHFIESPTNVRLEQTEQGADVALQIESSSGPSTLLRFRSIMEPERLDGILP